MTKTIPTYASVMDDWMIDQREQERKDAEILEKVKNCVSTAHFKHIEFELEESEHPVNYKIIKAPIGNEQYDEDNHYTIWIDQGCGETGDNYSGTVCVKVSDNKYLIWDYWM